MTTGTFKRILEHKLKGDVDMPTDDLLADLHYEACVEIAMLAEPKAITKPSSDADLLRSFACGVVEIPPMEDFNSNETMWLDESLCFAAIYLVLGHLSTEKRNMSRDQAETYISQHVAVIDSCNEV